jgi:hypothetical protein
MLRPAAPLQDPLRLIGFGFRFGERQIAVLGSSCLLVGDQPTPEAIRGADQAELTK